MTARQYDPALTPEERREIDQALDELDALQNQGVRPVPGDTMRDKLAAPVGIGADGRTLNIVNRDELPGDEN